MSFKNGSSQAKDVRSPWFKGMSYVHVQYSKNTKTRLCVCVCDCMCIFGIMVIKNTAQRKYKDRNVRIHLKV